MKIQTICRFCNATLIRNDLNNKGGYFCNIKHKAEWQKTLRPVSVEWLRQKYLAEGLDCTQIANLVNRDSKSVWNWLIGSGIPTRHRGDNPRVHFKKGEPSRFKGRKHTKANREKQRQARLKDGRVPCYVNGIHWLHYYKGRHPASWRGGISPERQSFYSSEVWKVAVKKVWCRDDATCQKCGLRKDDNREVPFDIHHIAGFENKQLRAEPLNLILLCEKCHYWTHSRKNVNRLLLR